MGFYSRVIFPRAVEWAMSKPEIGELRSRALAGVSGEVLEIGFGTGLNLPHYPGTVRRLTTVDVNPGMSTLAGRRVRESTIEVEHRVLSGERLPMADDSFDSAVSTWTLCSIADLDAALAEIRRVLRPGGRFFFVEHGLSRDPGVARWQQRLNGLQRLIGDGCNLNRDMRELIGERFELESMDEFYMEKAPRTHGYTYLGAARR
jgi:ubiquinone/menaquinone biosynthesis C-methylase UbiE